MILKFWRMYRSAVVTAEALAWHHVRLGVAMAKAAAEGQHNDRLEAFHA